MILRSYLALFFLLFITSKTIASPNEYHYTDIDALRDELKEFAIKYFQDIYQKQAKKGDLEVEINSLDNRLQLKKCDKPLSFLLNTSSLRSSSASIKTTCPGTNQWTVYVPVTIRVFDKVIVASRNLSRGAVIDKDDLTLQRVNISRFGSGYILDTSQLIGMELKRQIQAGDTLKLSYIKSPDVVTRGDSVLLEARNSGIRISVKGTALDHGHVGEQIRVRNNQSEKVIDALVTGPGRVMVVSR